MKKILVACGAGIATSTIVCDRVERLVKENNIQAEVEQCKIAECSTKQEGADLIVSTTILPTTYDIPNCHLYTSPRPRDKKHTSMTTSD
ncbi:PTS galactitol transporter subunit IIB [Clostridioides difficile]|uniref:PTS sugar transporter subunit IIB n=1 Tax=Clostridioides difficile TaxID=1496 RepID=UPI000BC61AF3|nr:PTS sugar transporter subunit IIB [Clostridioides difficile]PBH36165.1 PTS galactitol transporter subunit IIB [Clostridioides difficile]